MAFTATAIDLGHGNRNVLEDDATRQEWVRIAGTIGISDTANYALKSRKVLAVVGLPANFTWTQTGNNLVLTAVVANGATSADIIVLSQAV